MTCKFCNVKKTTGHSNKVYISKHEFEKKPFVFNARSRDSFYDIFDSTTAQISFIPSDN